MTVGELRKALEKFEDEETIMVYDTNTIAVFYDVVKVQYTVTGPKIYIGN